MPGPKMSTEHVPANVRRLLGERSQSDLARALEVPAWYLSDRMLGRVTWSAADLVALCEVLGVDPADLLAEAPDLRPTGALRAVP